MHFRWPGSWEVQFVCVQGTEGGLSVWSQDTAMRFKGMAWQRRGDHIDLAFDTQNYAPFDDLTAAESVEWRLAFHKGDWRVPARRYREWMHKTYPLTRIEEQQPAWVRDIRFVVITHSDRRIIDELAKHVPPKATLLYLPGWRRDRYDVNYPDYTARDGFADFVRVARSLGYHVMPHMNYFGCDPKHPAYERFGQWHLRAPSTGEHLWWIPPRERGKDAEPTIKFAYINPASRAWRDELTRRLVEAQKRYGFDAIHLDQTLCITNDPSGAIDGLRCPQGNVLLHRQLREAMPDVALSGEGLNEVTFRHEAFAQRHAPGGVDHVYGTWDDARIARGHPISSFLLVPYTRIYGYLGMAGPVNRGLYLAWKRAYEPWGVLPTYARPTVGQIAGSDAAKVALLEARVWADYRLTPRFEGIWPPDTLFVLQGKGAIATYGADPGGGSRMQLVRGSTSQIVYALVRGRRAVEGGGTIADWFAYDERRLFGLDPASTYIYTEQPRDLRVAHIDRAPDDALIRVLMRDEQKLMAELVGLPEASTHDFIRHVDEAGTGVVLDSRRTELAHGGRFDPVMAVCGGRRMRAIHAHPPWQVKAKTDEPPRSIGRYQVKLPADSRAFLEFAIGLTDGVNGRSDGVGFRVEVDGAAVFEELWDKSEWKQVSLPLDRWRGKRVAIAFITTTGPAKSPSFDWAVWGEPRIRYELPPRRIDVRLASPRPVEMALGTDPTLTWRRSEAGGMHACEVSVAMPGRIVWLWAKPKPVTLPLDLAAEPFTVSLAVEDTPAAPPIQHAGARPGDGTSNGVRREGINAHPPNHGRTSIDYLLELPEGKPIALSFACGLRDGSQSDSIVFIVEANGRELFRRQVTSPDGWHPARIDLSEFGGKAVLLSLVVDADGPYSYDWGTWAQPRLLVGKDDAGADGPQAPAGT